MKYYLFGHKIKSDSRYVKDLIDFVNETEGNLTIALSSEGGDVGASLLLIELLNHNKERIHLIAAGVIYSSAFDIWVGFRGYKSVFPGAMGMTHMADTTVRITEKGSHFSEDEVTLQNSISFAEIAEEITFPVMTVKQIAAYEEGKDVYFTCDNLRKIATRQNRKHRAKKPAD